LHGGRGPTLVRADDAVGIAEQICDERATVDWRGGVDYTVEFPDGHPVVEDDAGADLREYGGAEAGGGYAAVFVSPGAGFDRSGRAAGRRQFGERFRAGRGCAVVATRGRAGGEFYRIYGSRAGDRAGVRT